MSALTLESTRRDQTATGEQLYFLLRFLNRLMEALRGRYDL